MEKLAAIPEFVPFNFSAALALKAIIFASTQESMY